jgi:hypothetical protein
MLRRSLATMAILLTQAGCPSSDSFELVFDDLDATLFSVWGGGPDDIWAVGADAGDGPLVLHYDGDAWSRMATGASGDLWWVSGRGDDIWMSGDGGLIVRYGRASSEFEVMRAPGAEDNLTLFGIFPIAADEVWAVGGVSAVEGRVGRAYRFDGSAWSLVDDLPEAANEDPLFKVWGRGRDDLWIVGLGNAAFHRGPDGWTEVPTDRRLLTVHGNDDTVLAVGGFASGYIVEAQDGALVDVSPQGIEEMIGVYVEPDGTVVTVGIDGAVWKRQDGVWAPVLDSPTPPTGLDYHGVFVDSAGGLWAVGGEITVPPFNRGILSYRGPGVSNEIR